LIKSADNSVHQTWLSQKLFTVSFRGKHQKQHYKEYPASVS